MAAENTTINPNLSSPGSAGYGHTTSSRTPSILLSMVRKSGRYSSPKTLGSSTPKAAIADLSASLVRYKGEILKDTEVAPPLKIAVVIPKAWNNLRADPTDAKECEATRLQMIGICRGMTSTGQGPDGCGPDGDGLTVDLSTWGWGTPGGTYPTAEQIAAELMPWVLRYTLYSRALMYKDVKEAMKLDDVARDLTADLSGPADEEQAAEEAAAEEHKSARKSKGAASTATKLREEVLRIANTMVSEGGAVMEKEDQSPLVKAVLKSFRRTCSELWKEIHTAYGKLDGVVPTAQELCTATNAIGLLETSVQCQVIAGTIADQLDELAVMYVALDENSTFEDRRVLGEKAAAIAGLSMMKAAKIAECLSALNLEAQRLIEIGFDNGCTYAPLVKAKSKARQASYYNASPFGQATRNSCSHLAFMKSLCNKPENSCTPSSIKDQLAQLDLFTRTQDETTEEMAFRLREAYESIVRLEQQLPEHMHLIKHMEMIGALSLVEKITGALAYGFYQDGDPVPASDMQIIGHELDKTRIEMNRLGNLGLEHEEQHYQQLETVERACQRIDTRLRDQRALNKRREEKYGRQAEESLTPPPKKRGKGSRRTRRGRGDYADAALLYDGDGCPYCGLPGHTVKECNRKLYDYQKNQAGGNACDDYRKHMTSLGRKMAEPGPTVLSFPATEPDKCDRQALKEVTKPKKFAKAPAAAAAAAATTKTETSLAAIMEKLDKVEVQNALLTQKLNEFEEPELESITSSESESSGDEDEAPPTKTGRRRGKK